MFVRVWWGLLQETCKSEEPASGSASACVDYVVIWCMLLQPNIKEHKKFLLTLFQCVSLPIFVKDGRALGCGYKREFSNKKSSGKLITMVEQVN